MNGQNIRHTLWWLSIFAPCQVLLSYAVIWLMGIELERINHEGFIINLFRV